VPLGLFGIAFVLLACAVVNLFTKEIATIAGIVFTGAFFTMFQVSERIVHRRRADGAGHLDHFQLDTEREIGLDSLGCREGNVLVPVRDYNTLTQLDWVLGQPEAEGRDIIVLTVRVLGQGRGTPGVSDDQMFSGYEQTLFTKVVAIAERHGRRVALLITPGTNIFDALAQSAIQLRSGLIVVGESEIMTPEQQAHLLGEAWDRAPRDSELATRFLVLRKNGSAQRFTLGAHLPDLSAEDITRIHRLWLEAVREVGPEIHHRDIVTAALTSLEEQLHGTQKSHAAELLRRHLQSPTSQR
jgi:hypothetical protein